MTNQNRVPAGLAPRTKRMNTEVKRYWVLRLAPALLMLLSALAPAWAQEGGKLSKTIGEVLRQPLPPEELSLTSKGGEWIITGPTFVYRVQKTTGAISALRVMGEGQEVIGTSSPADIQIDDYGLASKLTSGKVTVLTEGRDKMVLRGQGVLGGPAKGGPEVDYTLLHTFFNDGVVVSSVKLTPRKDLPVQKALRYQLQAQGQFSHYLHKRRDEHGEGAVRGSLPDAGKAVRLSTLTSCLQVFSPSATLALFTDCGATHLSRENLDTAVVEVISKENQRAQLSLCQYLLHVGPEDKPYVLKAGEDFSFRVGISVAPNRLAAARMHDLRMYAWIGDEKYPYATDQEIEQVAKAGYTLFQMHRLGTPGEPRPPAGELERVIKKVHELGMLFLWTENADLMYASAPGVQELQAKGQWPQWQGPWPGGGRYQATMDPYCDLVATCHGLAERVGRLPAGHHRAYDGAIRR